MKRIFLAAAAFCFLASCAAAPAANNNARADHEAGAKKFINEFAAALSKNDVAALDKLWADDYRLVTSGGEVMNKAQRLEAIRSGDIAYENVAFDEINVRSYGDVAVAVARSTGKTRFKGKDSNANYRVTLVLVKTKDGMRMASAQTSNIAE